MTTLAQWFPQVSQAHQAVLDLLTSGLSRNDISVVIGPPGGGQPEGARSGQPEGGPADDGAPRELAAALAGSTTVTLPGAGAVMAAGPVAEALAEAGGGSADAAYQGALRALGVDAGEAAGHAAQLGAGGTLVVVRADDAWETVVRGVFRHNADPGLSNPGEAGGPEEGREEAAGRPEPPSSSVGALTGGIIPAGWGPAGADLEGQREDGRGRPD